MRAPNRIMGSSELFILDETTEKKHLVVKKNFGFLFLEKAFWKHAPIYKQYKFNFDPFLLLDFYFFLLL